MRPTQLRSVFASLLSSVCACVVVVGCGSGAGAGVANLGSSKTMSATSHASSAESVQSQGLRYAACMRAHGEPNFPDPSSSGGIKIQLSSGVDPGSQYKAAANACKAFLPSAGITPTQQEQRYASALKYAACMRAHGEPNSRSARSRQCEWSGFAIKQGIIRSKQRGQSQLAAVHFCQ